MTMRGIGRAGRPGDHRCTPEPIWRAALEAAGIERFDLDPASNPFATIPAETSWHGGAYDGRKLAWFGNVWINYPWSVPVPWVCKIIKESKREEVRSITANGAHDLSTAWAQQITNACDAWAAWPKRLHYPLPNNPSGSPPGSVALWYFGPNAETWIRVMHAFGCIAYPKHVDD